MNMSGPYSGHFSGQPFGQPNQHQQYFAEYSLWGSSPFRLEPAQLINPIIHHPGVFGHQISPNPEPEPVTQPVVQEPPEVVAQASEGPMEDEPDLSGLGEPIKRIIEKEALYKHPDNFYFDLDANQDTEVASNSSGSSTGADWTHNNFQRAGAFPSAYPWASRPSRVVNNRGKKANMMQRRLVKALSQPVKMDKGASMMQRMGWMGGGLGREESGITNPIAPNAVYATTTMGFGQEVEQIQHLSSKRSNRASCVKKQRSKQSNKANFRSNVLLHILDFVKDDLQVELYFDVKLQSNERKRIHRIVGALTGVEEANGELKNCTSQQEEMIKDIKNRIFYNLATQSEGEGSNRQICVYKEAPSHMFLITPDDCRPALTEIKEIEEDTNPFLKSITKHIKKDEGTVIHPIPPHLFDKLVNYFIDFSTDVYTELRFLGPFTKKEIFVINNFVSLINDLSKKTKPYFNVPVELLDVFSADFVYTVHMDINGFVSIKRSTETFKEQTNQADVEQNGQRQMKQ